MVSFLVTVGLGALGFIVVVFIGLCILTGIVEILGDAFKGEG